MGTGDFGDKSSHQWRFGLVLHRAPIRVPRLRTALGNRRGVRCQAHCFAVSALSRNAQPPLRRHARIRSRVAPLERVFRRSATYSRILSTSCFWQMNAFLQSLHQHDLRVLQKSVTGELNYLFHRIFSGVTRFATVSRIERAISKQPMSEQTFQGYRGYHPIVARPAIPAEDGRPGKRYSQELVLRRASSEPLMQRETLRAVAAEPAAKDREIKFAQARHSFSPADLSPRDWQSLTDTVLRTLDHRILAKRERLGRS
jgi:hypothetical protein